MSPYQLNYNLYAMLLLRLGVKAITVYEIPLRDLSP